jgi:serine/threonine protein kinase
VSHEREVVAGRYRLLDRIGSGGMGQVWLAWDERLSRAVALKRLHEPVGLSQEDADLAHERAMREARITARLHHANAVPVYDVVDHEGAPCLVMQYLPSRSLHEVLATEGTLEPREAARIGSGIAAALAAAHEAGIVHRDVKPGNILLTTAGTPLLTDFGISRGHDDPSLTATGLLTGTPAYLAPEVARGAASTPAADVFALGATLYAAVEGTPPFGLGDNPMALLHQVASGSIDPPHRAGPLEPVLLRMLAADPEARPRRGAAAAALAAVADASGPTSRSDGSRARESSVGHTAVLPVAGIDASREEPHEAPTDAPSDAPTDASPDAPRERGRRRPAAVLLGAAAVLAALVVAVVLATRGDAPPVSAPSGGASSTAASTPTRATSPPRTSSPRTSAPPTSTAPTPTATRSTSRPAPSRPTGGTVSPGPPTAAELARAVRDYYAVLPGDTDAGWALLTPRYRTTTSGDRRTYDRFWGSIARVRVSGVEGSAPSSAVATLRYDYKDGRTYIERTAYTLVQDGGRLKIDRTSVLSSRQV